MKELTMRFRDRVVLVTGGGSGIGRACAVAFAREGASVVVADVDESGSEDTLAEIKAADGHGITIYADVTRAADTAAMVQAALSAFGALDIALNNAGISGGFGPRLHEVEDSTFDQVMNVNVKGVWHSMKSEIPVMLEQREGCIINMASVAGLIGSPKGAAYAASKHAVVGLTRSTALEYARFNLRINAVCPSFTDTPMVNAITEHTPAMQHITANASPLKRLATSEEIAAAVLWLASDAASFVNGVAFPIDGGLTAM